MISINYKDRILQLSELTIGLTALLVGGLIYIVFRDERLLMFRWFDELGLSIFLSNLRVEYGHQNIYGWIKNSMPAGLWLFSYLFIVDSIWWKEKGIIYKGFIFVLPIMSIGSEIMQYYKVLPGTFDVLDICSYMCAVILFLLIKKL